MNKQLKIKPGGENEEILKDLQMLESATANRKSSLGRGP